MFDNDVKIIDISATPNGVWWNVSKWESYSKMVFMDPGKGYVSSGDLLKLGKLKEYKSLSAKTPEEKKERTTNILDLKASIDSFKTPSYHVIRTETGTERDKVLDALKVVMNEDNYKYITFDQTSEITDINEILNKEPEKHTIILLKEMLRCAKSINKKYIGVLYERYAKRPDNSVIIQGLLGRLTGYDYNGKSICYTHIESVELYETCWNTKFEDVSKWSSGSTVKKKGIVSGKNTFASPTLVTGLSSEEEQETKTKVKTTTKSFDDYDTCKEYIITHGWKVPVKKRLNSSGFYAYKAGNTSKIYTVTEAKSVANSGLLVGKGDIMYRYHVGYSDTTDKNSVKHIVVHK
jgi:hypothetical protein